MATVYSDKSYGGAEEFYKTALKSFEKFLRCFENFCSKYPYHTLPHRAKIQISHMADSTGCTVSNLKKAYIFTTYTPDIDFISCAGILVKKVRLLKDKIKLPYMSQCNKTPSAHHFKKLFDELCGIYQSAMHCAGEIIDTGNHRLTYSHNKWPEKSVLLGTLRNSKQLGIAIKHGFYHIPQKLVPDPDSIKCVAIYQSQNLFGKDSGIKYYGKVLAYKEVPRHDIAEIPSSSDEMYIRFEIESWKTLKKIPIADYIGDTCVYTTLFQFLNCEKTSELLLDTKEEFELYEFMKENAFTANTAVYCFEGLQIISKPDGFEIFKDDKSLLKITSRQFLGKGVALIKLVATKARTMQNLT